MCKKCAPFTDCISEINNTQVDNTKNLDATEAMYKFMKYSDNYLITFVSLS